MTIGPNRAELHRASLLKDVRFAARDRIKRDSYADAEVSKQEIDAFGKMVAIRYRGWYSGAPLKSEGRAAQKVDLDYNMDWHQIKDIARATIIAPSAIVCQAILMEIEQHLSVRKAGGLGVVQVKNVTADQDPCGYSSTTVFVRTSTGRAAEIQINVREILYAKQSEQSVTRVIGPGEYNSIKSKYRLEGGMGHRLYEIYRVAPGAHTTPKVQDVSKAYYAYFRKGHYDQMECDRIKRDLAALGLLGSSPGSH